MSKFVKDLITNDLKRRLEGVQEAVLVNVIGMTANANSTLRRELRAKNLHLLVIKNSLARRAAEGTPLAAAFTNVEGTSAVIWGAEDIVSLAKEVKRIAEDKKYEPFAPRGGVLDGAALSADEVIAVSKWPSRMEQLSLLVGQILSPGAMLASQLSGPGGALASQIKSKGDDDGPADAAAEAAPEGAAT